MEVFLTFVLDLALRYLWDRVLGLPLQRSFWKRS